MQPVDRQRAWALRGPFVLVLDDGRKVKIRWPAADVLLDHDSSGRPLERVARLAGSKASDLVELLLSEDPIVIDLMATDLECYFGCTQSHRLVSLLNRYDVPISNELAEMFGIDILDLHRGKLVPDQVMDRIDGFARHSRLSEALAQDDALAAQLRRDDDNETEPSAPSVRHTEWTPEVEHLALIVDRLGGILGLIASIGGTSINLPPAPRPVGAAARLRADREQAAYEDVFDDVAAAHEQWRASNPTTPEEG